jgi:hypothetical protein
MTTHHKLGHLNGHLFGHVRPQPPNASCICVVLSPNGAVANSPVRESRVDALTFRMSPEGAAGSGGMNVGTVAPLGSNSWGSRRQAIGFRPGWG